MSSKLVTIKGNDNILNLEEGQCYIDDVSRPIQYMKILNGRPVLHREDGPVFEHRDGRYEWRIDGELHREDGPAAEWSKNHLYFWHGRKCKDEHEFLRVKFEYFIKTL